MKKISYSNLLLEIQNKHPGFKEETLDLVLNILKEEQNSNIENDKNIPFSNIEKEFIISVVDNVYSKKYTGKLKNQYKKSVKDELVAYKSKGTNFKFLNKVLDFTARINHKKFKDNPKSIKIIIITLLVGISFIVLGSTWVEFQRTQSVGVERRIEELTNKKKDYYKNFSWIKSFTIKDSEVSVASNNDENGFSVFYLENNKLKGTFSKADVENPIIWLQVIETLKIDKLDSIKIKDNNLYINDKKIDIELKENDFVVQKVQGKKPSFSANIFLSQNAQKDILKKWNLNLSDITVKSVKINSFNNLEVLFIDNKNTLYSIITSPSGKVEGRVFHQLDYKKVLGELENI
jgi:hypothetical protein